MGTQPTRFVSAVGVLCWIGLSGACAGASPGPEPTPLRVGTIGDSPPYSLATASGFVGIDIDLAMDLGRELERPVQFVPTTWTSLVRDARDQRFDVAMSAINILPSRTMFVDFSRPYSQQHYAVIVRCEDRDRFSSLDDVNRADVTIFAKQGTAQAEFALRNLGRTRVRQFADVTELYDRLTAGEGDAVIGRPLQIRDRPVLCLALDNATVSSAPIAILLPPSSPLARVVDDWLARRIADGTVASLLRHYGVSAVRSNESE